MNNSKNTQHTTFYSRKKQRFKYSEIKYKLHLWLVKQKEKLDKPLAKYLIAYARDIIWQILLITIILLSFKKPNPLTTSIGITTLIHVSMSYLDDIIQKFKK
jgi:hypothetical protein